MGIIPFPNREEPDIFSVEIGELDGAGLQAFRAQVEDALAELDSREPNEGTAAYDKWAERHEFLEDILDDVLDRLEDMDM